MLKAKAMLKVLASTTIVASICMAAALGEDKTPAPSIKDLDILIGKWRYVDQSTELAGFDYREEGVTECRYALDDKYIRCDGEGLYNGKSRTYVDYFNYNQFTGEFQRVGLFGNHPAIATFTLQVIEDGNRIEQRGAPMSQRDGTHTRNWGVITFSDENNYTWHAHVNRSNEAPDHWPLKFVSTYERITDE